MPEIIGEAPEGVEEASPEDQQKFDQLTREIDREIWERIAADPSFKDRLIEDPEAAMEEAGLTEKIEAVEGTSEVAGHHAGMRYTVVYRRCLYGTSVIQRHWHNTAYVRCRR